MLQAYKLQNHLIMCLPPTKHQQQTYYILQIHHPHNPFVEQNIIQSTYTHNNTNMYIQVMLNHPI